MQNAEEVSVACTSWWWFAKDAPFGVSWGGLLVSLSVNVKH